MLEYVITFLLLTALSYLYDKYRSKMNTIDETENEKLIREYLLTDKYTPDNKPPVWIYLDNDINSRNWLSFGSRNSRKLNQPYLNITIRSIINRCNDNFNVCIINDDSLHKVLPSWSIDMKKLANPTRCHFRQLALMKLLYNYGGMIIPSSYLALKDLDSMYYENISDTGCFTAKLPSNSILSNISNSQPSIYFMGCEKQNTIVKELCQELELLNTTDYTNDRDFNGNIERLLNKYIMNKKLTLISGKYIGVTDKYDEPITINELLSTYPIEFIDKLQGIYIPKDEILKRSKYQWFSKLNENQIYSGETNLSKYMLLSN